MTFLTEVERIQQSPPLLHNMTNQVVANFVANGLLAIGASPIMAYAPEEMAEITSQSGCLILNIGTVTREVLDSMLIAGKTANDKKIPVVLDPVGVGASRFRQEVVAEILGTVKVTLIRGNSGELAQLAAVPWQAQGVDGGVGQASLREVALIVAQKYNCLSAISGPTDYLSNGREVVEVTAGSPVMTKITGTGCLLSGVCGAFLATGTDEFTSVIAAHTVYGQIGAYTADQVTTPGSFHVQFLDNLSRASTIVRELSQEVSP